MQTIVADGRVVGNIVSWDQSGDREIGYWIGRDHWGRGIATEALALFLGHVNRSRPLHAHVAVPTTPARSGVLEKCGFQRLAAQEIQPLAADGIEEIALILKA